MANYIYVAQFKKNECCTDNKLMEVIDFSSESESLEYLEACISAENNIYYYSDVTIECLKEEGVDTDWYKGEGYYESDRNFISASPLELDTNYSFGDYEIYRVIKRVE